MQESNRTNMEKVWGTVFLTGLLMMACEKQQVTLFTLVDPNESGVDFTNQIYEDEQINILELEYVYNGGGVSVGDFNNDGLNDLFFTGNMVPNKLFLNKGELEFTDVSETAGIGGDYKWKSGSALVDINLDGWLDIYVCATISGDSTLRRNMMFVNQRVDGAGNISFKDEGRKYGIDYSGFSSNAGFFDSDNDGDLDLYILTNSKQPGIPVTWRPKVNDGTSTNTDKLFRNDGNGLFTDVSQASGIICEGYGLGLAFLDVNKDGLTDIYVSNDYITNDLLYVNQGGGIFKNEIDKYVKHQSKFSMGNDVADINNDGFLDIITVDMLPETNFRKKTVIGGSGYIAYINDWKFGYAHQYIRNMLQLNNGNNTFSEIGQLAGVFQTEWSWSPLLADFDNDGFRDLIVTNGFPRDVTDRDFISFRQQSHGLLSKDDLLKEVPSVRVPNSVFRNNGDLTFTEVTREWGFDRPSFSNGAAYGDLDNDGDLDYVVNNINEPASLYKNNLYAIEKNANHYLRIKLKDKTGNPSGLGTKLTLFQKDKTVQYAEHSIHRGYVSTVEDFVHFGLGKVDGVDSLVVQWPDGNNQTIRDIKGNQVLILEKNSGSATAYQRPGSNQQVIFGNVNSESGLDFIHKESDKIDFNIQRTLPHKLSQSGPGIAVGDINNDGLDDFVVGGSALFPSWKFIQTINGKFRSEQIMKDAKPEEDMGVLLFDSDKDGDLDLYCVSGSYEYAPRSPNYQDRLYKNDGNGNFKLDPLALPTIGASGSCVRAADFDADGDLDLFVGGRTPPGSYPLADRSYLLANDKGVFSDVTNEVCVELATVGMVVDAIWTDFNNDGKIDLAIVGEFMAVTFFQNTGSKFKRITNSGIEEKVGWLNSIVGGDFDNDGDTDYLVGNLGLNNFYNASLSKPLSVCAKDFDGNGSMDAILSCFAKSEDGELKSYPIHFWDELNQQSPKFRQRYDHYKEFAKVTTEEFFTPEELKGSYNLSATYMETSVIYNLGDNKFSIQSLPKITQVAPVNGMVVTDLNSDGNLDAVLVGNDYGNEPTYGRYDAFTGLVLLGDGQGAFRILGSRESGFFVDKDAKGLALLAGKYDDYIIATQNRDSLRAVTFHRTLGLPEFSPTASDNWGQFIFSDGRKQKIEFYFGSGYLSQSTRKIRVPDGVVEFIVLDYKGASRKVLLKEVLTMSPRFIDKE
jgi:enediyne biosynthesis protein E4